MAEQALLTLASQQALRPLVYRLPTASLCDRIQDNPVMRQHEGTMGISDEQFTSSGLSFFSIPWVNHTLNRVKQVWSQRPGNLVLMSATSAITSMSEEKSALDIEGEPLLLSQDEEAMQPPIDAEQHKSAKIESEENTMLSTVPEPESTTSSVPNPPLVDDEAVGSAVEPSKAPVDLSAYPYADKHLDTDTVVAPSPEVVNKQLSASRAAVQPQNLGGHPRTAPRQHYTIQLGSAATPEGLIASAQRHRLSNYTVYETVRHGRQWYVLVAGEYVTSRVARQAIKTLPAQFLTNQPWVRSLAHVQDELLPE
ncbi:SPOR domain-containing protein [Providencia rettgeri]|nr:SPOR domain-containing protein [Providencia rettgeri]